MMGPLWSETCWSNFKYFKYFIIFYLYLRIVYLCICWIIKFFNLYDLLGGWGGGACWVEKSWCQWRWYEVYCLFVPFFSPPCNCGWSRNCEWCHNLGFIISSLLLCGRFRGRFVTVLLARSDGGCSEQSLPIGCCVQQPNRFHFSRNILPVSQ